MLLFAFIYGSFFLYTKYVLKKLKDKPLFQFPLWVIFSIWITISVGGSFIFVKKTFTDIHPVFSLIPFISALSLFYFKNREFFNQPQPHSKKDLKNGYIVLLAPVFWFYSLYQYFAQNQCVGGTIKTCGNSAIVVLTVCFFVFVCFPLFVAHKLKKMMAESSAAKISENPNEN